MVQIGESHQSVCGSDYRVVKTEWELTLSEGYGSFEVNKMKVQNDQLLNIKKATNTKTSILGSMRPKSKGKEDLGAVTEAVPSMFLLAVQEGHDPYHGQPAGTSVGQCPQAPQHFCQHGVEVTLPLVL